MGYSFKELDTFAKDMGILAKSKKLKPCVPSAVEIEQWKSDLKNQDAPSLRCAELGAYRPIGWKKTDQWRVASYGDGCKEHQSISVEDFLRCLINHFAQHPNDGLAIVYNSEWFTDVAAFTPKRSK